MKLKISIFFLFFLYLGNYKHFVIIVLNAKNRNLLIGCFAAVHMSGVWRHRQASGRVMCFV